MVDELREAVKRYTETAGRQNPFTTTVSGPTLLRSDRERRPQPLIHRPALCAAVQGAKREIFGDRQLEYRAGQALIVSFETPAFGTIVEASPREPFLGVVIEFDLAIMRDVVGELSVPPRASEPRGPGIFVTDLSGPLADSVLRLVRLLDSPAAIPILYPAIMREICFWILAGRHAGEIIRLTMAKTYESTVIRAIHALRRGFAKAIRIHERAAMAKMSPTTFHRHFKTMTSMTPLQYQKQLRLIEARRLMLSEALNVESAAFKVGYESPSQFTRGICAYVWCCTAARHHRASTRRTSIARTRGNSAVRHYRGASENVATVEMRTQLGIERAGLITLHLQPARRSSIPTTDP